MKHTRIFPFRLWCSVVMLALVIVSCVDTVDLQSQLHERSRLVLYCRLCPQMDTNYVNIYASRLLYSNYHADSTTRIVGAVVELSNDHVHWVRAEYNDRKKSYQIARSALPILEGQTYYIRASYPGYDDVSSVCTVPFLRNVQFVIDTVQVSGDVHMGTAYNQLHRDCYFQWTDYPGEANYYMVFESYERYMGGNFYHNGYCISFWEDDKDVCLITDENRDGQTIRLLYDYDIDENYQDDEVNKVRYMLFLDSNSYLFEKTVTYTGEFFSSFLLEPKHTYTNIENGYGLFGAFCLQEID